MKKKITETLSTGNQESPGTTSSGDLQNLKISNIRITAFLLLLPINSSSDENF